MNYIDDLYIPNSDDSRNGFDFGRLLLFRLTSCIWSTFLHMGLHGNLASRFASPHIYSSLHSGCMLILVALDDIVQDSDCHRIHIPKNLDCWAAARLYLPGISSYALPNQETLNPSILRRKPEFQSSSYRLWLPHQA